MYRYNFGWLGDGILFLQKNVRKTEGPKDTPTEFELRDTAAGIQRRREEREQREGGGAVKQQREKGRGVSLEGGHSRGRNFPDSGGNG